MQGKIIRGIGGFYYVHTHQGVYECRARGIFRKDKEKPLPGDLVSISVLDETEKKGNLDEILPRTNSLIRPAVANVDQALVIFALVSPKPNFNLLDRFLVLMEKQKTIGELMEEMRVKAGAQNYYGHEIQSHIRTHPNIAFHIFI